VIIGIDARAAAEVPAGRGRVVRELLPALDALGTEHRFELFCRRPWRDVELGPRFAWKEIALPDPLWHAAAAARARGAMDAFFSTNSYLTAWMLSPPCVILVHDLIAFLPSARGQARATRIERATIRPAIRRAARLVCNSRSTEADLIRLFPRSAGKTSVIGFAAGERFHDPPHGARLAAILDEHGAAEDGFVLASGTLEPRKNLPRLVRAHARLPESLRRSHPLLIAGPHGWEEDELMRTAHGREDVRLLGFVPEEHLAALYGAASVFCYPSLYEGFGLPVLEAMAAGACVVTSDRSSLPEVGGDAVVYADPDDEASIARALERLLRAPQERRALGERGRARARTMSWEQTARGVVEELERAVRGE
jgi:alpha-1,3-rhamnosyl/mannosyltransferase